MIFDNSNFKVPISNKATSDSHGFDTFGDSTEAVADTANKNKKITAISELHSPGANSPPIHQLSQ